MWRAPIFKFPHFDTGIKHFTSCCGGLFWSYVYIAPLRCPPSQTGGSDSLLLPPTPRNVRRFHGSGGAASHALSSTRQLARASKHTHVSSEMCKRFQGHWCNPCSQSASKTAQARHWNSIPVLPFQCPHKCSMPLAVTSTINLTHDLLLRRGWASHILYHTFGKLVPLYPELLCI